jgi:hypothetical protein
MSKSDTPSQPALGFLSILEHEQLGLVGGYLILNTAGRPLEFHCTAPVKPNRAQQILFGPTLEPYLYGEQIGQALLARSALDLLAVCTDVERALVVRDYVSLPVALVIANANGAAAQAVGPAQVPAESRPASDSVVPVATVWRVDAAQRGGPHLSEFTVGANRLAVPAHRHEDSRTIAERLAGVATFDLVEPFERIRQAVEEAHKSGRA